MENKEPKPKGLLPRMELLVIGILLISFLFWGITRCSNNRREMNEVEIVAVDSSQIIQAAADSVKAAENLQPSFKPEYYTRLFVTIDGLNLRAEPELEGELLVKLPLYETVYFMNEVTDSTFQINLGKEVADEPWVKVRSKKGHIGWVYGAGVDYYKYKRAGVE